MTITFRRANLWGVCYISNVVGSSSPESKSRLSLIAPAFNEEDKIVGFLRKVVCVLNSLGYEYEVLVVDDGSTDLTRQRAMSAVTDSRVRVISYSCNQGKGWAAREGIRHAYGDIAIFMDSDSEVSPQNLRQYVLALQKADIAIASKRHPGSTVSAPILRKFLITHSMFLCKS